MLLPVAVSVRIVQGSLSEAEDFYHKLERAAARYSSNIWVAMARQARGELQGARGDIDGALVSYDEALAGFQASGYEYEVARCMLRTADLRLERQAPEDIEQGEAAQVEAQHILHRLRTA